MERVIDEKAPGLVIFDRKTKGQQEYWVKQLSREIDSSNIALDYPRPRTYSGETEVVAFELTPDVYRRLIDLVRDGDFLLYTTLLAALKVCLHKYTGNRTIVVGSPSRKQENAAPHTGNALAIVDEVHPQLQFKQLLINVRQTLLDAYSNQHYPFERLVRDLELEHLDNKCPLFDVELALSNIHHPTANLKIHNEEKIIPGNGIYAVYGELENGPRYKGMMSIGFRPTVDGKKRVIEVNIFDFDEDIYGQTLQVHVHHYLRGEVKFNGLDELKNQLQKDKLAAIELLQTS